MTEFRNPSIAGRFGLYAAVAAIVLAYVGAITEGRSAANPPPAATGANGRDPADHDVLARRLAVAGVAVALWILVDVAAAVYLKNTEPMTYYLVRVLLGWGMLLALGAMLSAGHQRWLAAAIVFGVTAAFVGLWLAALSSRRHAKARR
jgi:hypothetical protein